MIRENLKNPCIDILFQSEDKEDSKQSLIQKAPTSHQNVRLSAQKGSFLNFEKVLINDSITKIDRIRVIIDYDLQAHVDNLKKVRDDLGTPPRYLEELQSIVGRFDKYDNENDIESELQRMVDESEANLKRLLSNTEVNEDGVGGNS